MNDLELEELEAHLYSQVYHSNEEFDQNQSTLSFENLQTSVDTMKKPNRYFQRSPRPGGAKFQHRQITGTQHNRKSPVCNNDDQTEGIYSKNCTRPHKRDISINQLVVISPQQAPIVCVTQKDSNKQRKARWRATKWKAKMKEKRKQQKLVEMLNSNRQVECDVITVSDSDGDSCVEVADHWPVVSVTDSDEEAKKWEKSEESSDRTSKDANLSTQSLGDDVIFVEPVIAPFEVINLDEDVDNTRGKSEDVNAHVDIETITLSSNFINNYTQSKAGNARVHQERKELLCTPDSASNDFMHNVELNQDNFNFSLHGRDFTNDKFIKPANPTDTCETESSSSTTELNAVNAMKTVVFNEIEFPKDDIFSDANLESFGNFITPLRQSKDKQTTQSTPSRKTKKIQDENVYASADSSSESDYDEISIDKQKEPIKSKYLPDLSPMHSDNEVTQKGAKKAKKSANVSSKYDLINQKSDIIVKKNKHKKRKSLPILEALNDSKKKSKNKKRKTDTCIDNQSSLTMTEDVCSSTDNNLAVCPDITQSGVAENPSTSRNIDSEIKQKKRKSSQLADETCENLNNSHSKKRRSKKKKNNTETESDENVNDLETSVISQPQQVVDQPIKDQSSNEIANQTNAPSDNIAVIYDQVVQQSLVVLEADCFIKMAQDGADSIQLTQSEETVTVTAEFEEPEIDVENDSRSPQMLETSADDVILVEQPPNPEIVVSSEDESNLSPLVEQHDIQLLNCGDPSEPLPPPNISSCEGSFRPILDLSSSTLEEVQQTMSNDPKLWNILDSDRIPVREDIRGRRCNRCREKGHMAIRCPNKVTPKCYLCGEPGHYEPRCPNRICTQCGERSPYSTTYCKFCFKFRNHQCEICFMVGHGADTCPDLWRRYHLTTAEGPLTTFNGPLLKPKHKLWCSGCARPGHLEYTCRFFKSLYPRSDPHIKSYEDVYQNRGSAHTQGMEPPLFYNRNYPVQPNPMAQLVYPNPNSYQSNNFVMNPFVNNALGPMFQQNPAVFFNSGGGNVYPPNQFNLVHNQQSSNNHFYFEDSLPNFISFESPVATPNQNYQVHQERPYYNSNENEAPSTSTATDDNIRIMPRQVKQNSAVFFSSSTENIQHLISNELNQLVSLSYRVAGVVKNLKKQRLEFPKNHKQNRYYRTLNMVLFGIYKLLEGEKHLIKLKMFKMKPLKAKLSQERRSDLYRSYCYIFGIARHGGIDYNELLRRL